MIVNSRTTRPAWFSPTTSAALAEVAEADLLVISDEVYERLTFDGHTQLAAGDLPGHGGADAHHLQCRQDVQLHRLEDRLGLGHLNWSRAFGRAKQYLSYVGGAHVPAGGLRAQQRGRLGRFVARLTASQTRQAGPPRSRVWASRCTPAAPILRVDPGRWASTTAPHSARNCRCGPGWPRSRCRRSASRATPPAAWKTWCASRSANATPPSTRR